MKLKVGEDEEEKDEVFFKRYFWIEHYFPIRLFCSLSA